jgi:hypothetical protein
MISKIKIPLLFTLLILVYVLFSYSFLGDWLYSSIGTLLIIILSYLIWGKSFLKQVGLQLDLPSVAKSIILVVMVAACSLLIMKYIGSKHGIRIEYHDWRDYYHVQFYVLNEEIVLGAILLFGLVNKWKMGPLSASLCMAFLFSLVHYVFYKWIASESGILSISALATLFLVGFVRNSLIMQTGHIGYSWAIHFGWIAIMFGSGHTYKDSQMYLTEPDSFNLYLGSIEMLIISLILAGFSLAIWIMKYNRHQVRSQNQLM